MNKFTLMFAISIAAALAACSKSADQAPAGVIVAEVAQEKKAVALAPESLLALDKYIPVSMGRVDGDAQLAAQAHNMRALFWSGAPLDYDTLADDFIPAYKDEPDAFKRADLAKANKTVLDGAYEAARKNPYFSVKFDNTPVSIAKYDAGLKGFHVTMYLAEDTMYYWSRPEGKDRKYSGLWGVRLLGVDDFDYIPASEDEARAFEAALAQRRGGSDEYKTAVVVYGRVIGFDKEILGTDKLRRVALLRVDGLSFRDPKTNEILFTADKKTLPKTIKLDTAIPPENLAFASKAS